MLTAGNGKMGKSLIWGFGLPSGHREVCPGMTTLCQVHCYAVKLERLRPQVRRAYERNLALSQRDDFARRMRYFILAHDIRVVRIHTGGEFYSAPYARKWLWIIKRLRRVQFFCYSRAWRDPAIRIVLEEIATLRNCSVWYSCDEETGLPQNVPDSVRLAWLQVDSGKPLPHSVDLVFRDYPLRKQPTTDIAERVCPEQDGVVRRKKVTCEACRWCFRSGSTMRRKRLTLPLIQQTTTLELPLSMSK